MRCVSRLCSTHSSVVQQFLDIMTSLLATLPGITSSQFHESLNSPHVVFFFAFCALKGCTAVLVCECLASISAPHPEVLRHLLPEIIQSVTQRLESGDSENNSTVLVSLDFKERILKMWCVIFLQCSLQPLLCTHLFQASSGDVMTESVRDVILRIVTSVDSWVTYRIARQAARYAHHRLANELFMKLRQQVRLRRHVVNVI